MKYPARHGSEFPPVCVFVQMDELVRTLEQKKALYARIAELLTKEPGIRPEDVLINLVECAKEDWSFGNGLASYA
jgi:hypothetical protein